MLATLPALNFYAVFAFRGRSSRGPGPARRLGRGRDHRGRRLGGHEHRGAWRRNACGALSRLAPIGSRGLRRAGGFRRGFRWHGVRGLLAKPPRLFGCNRGGGRSARDVRAQWALASRRSLHQVQSAAIARAFHVARHADCYVGAVSSASCLRQLWLHCGSHTRSSVPVRRRLVERR